MKKQMTLSTDRKSASEGEYIEIMWACDACPDSLYLSIDSGHNRYNIAVSDSGTTRIPIPKSNGKVTIKLLGVISGKKVTESVDVRVKNAKPAKKSGISRLKLWKEKLQAGWYVYRAQVKYWWLSRKKWQKVLWIVLLTLWLGLIFSSIGRKTEVKVPSDQVQTAYLMR